MRLYLLRHGQTVWNLEGRLQGAKDSALTALGRSQAQSMAQLLKRHLKGQKIDLVSSPQGRALETAAYIASALALDIQTDERLVEITCGSWDGLLSSEIAQRDHEIIREATEDDWYFYSPDGERFAQVQNRVMAWLGSVERDTIVVSHGISGKILRGSYAGLGYAEILALNEPQGCVFCLEGGQVRVLS